MTHCLPVLPALGQCIVLVTVTACILCCQELKLMTKLKANRVFLQYILHKRLHINKHGIKYHDKNTSFWRTVALPHHTLEGSQLLYITSGTLMIIAQCEAPKLTGRHNKARQTTARGRGLSGLVGKYLVWPFGYRTWLTTQYFSTQ